MKIRRDLFPVDDSTSIWVEGKPAYSDSNVLLTITDSLGERSAYITNNSVTNLSAGMLVEPAVDNVSSPSKERFKTIRKASGYFGAILAILLLTFSAFSFTNIVKARIVLTGSMAPAIHTGDIILTTPITHKQPKIGDVIAYQAKRFNGESVAVFSHRIIGGDINDGFIVKGDSNKSPDSQKPKAEDILGVVVFVIPFIGNLLTPKALFLLVPCIFGFWLIIDAMKNVE